MNMKCLICGQQFAMAEDSPETRAAGVDPTQQMRKHLTRHPARIMKLIGIAGWLIDRLMFECPEDPAFWKTNTWKVLDWTEQEIRKQANA